MELIEVKNTDILTSYNPDFSVFSQPVINWSVSMAAGAQAEDYMTIAFCNIPKYKGGAITRSQELTIPLPNTGLQDIRMLVRDVNYQLTRDSSHTTITLGTNKLFLDQFIPGGKKLADAGATAKDVFSSLLDALHVLADIDAAQGLNWPHKNTVVITGKDNALDWIGEQLGKDAVFTWWFDIHNVLHIEPKLNSAAPTKEITYDSIKGIFNDFQARVTDKWHRYEAMTETSVADPTEDAPKKQTPDQQLSIDANYNATWSSRKTKARVGTTERKDTPLKSFKSKQILSQSATLRLTGLYWLEPHTKVMLKDFPAGDGEYIIKSITLHAVPAPVTTIMMQTPEIEVPTKKNDTSEDAPPVERKEDVVLSWGAGE